MAAGRPRNFDLDEALDRALAVFWQKGYEGASLADLTQAMGINPPSLYAAFGNKELLFQKALARYVSGPGDFVRRALDMPRARGVAEALLKGAVAAQTDPKMPKGCLIVQGALACGASADPVREALMERRQSVVAALQARLERARVEGDLPRAADPAVLARYLSAVVNGMAVQAADGASPAELKGVAEHALKAWPEAPDALQRPENSV